MTGASTLLAMLFSFLSRCAAPRDLHSLHDALPIFVDALPGPASWATHLHSLTGVYPIAKRSEEHTSELQSHSDLVCRLLLEKKKSLRSAPRGSPPRSAAGQGRDCDTGAHGPTSARP